MSGMVYDDWALRGPSGHLTLVYVGPATLRGLPPIKMF